MKTNSTPPPANISFELTEHFKKDLKALGKKYRSIEGDLDSLLEALEESPQSGTPLGRDCYKIRMAIASKQAGKSGGARVVTCVKIVQEKIYLPFHF